MSAEMPSTEPDSSQSILALKAEETRVDTRDTQPGPSPNTELAGFSSAESTPTPVALDTDLSGAAYPRTAQQIAYAILRRSIMNGTLAPGTRLTQNQVAAQLSMSTTPVREALRRLASDELIRIDAHRGAIVRGLDRQELIDVYELRVLLEPLAMRKAVENLRAGARRCGAVLRPDGRSLRCGSLVAIQPGVPRYLQSCIGLALPRPDIARSQ